MVLKEMEDKIIQALCAYKVNFHTENNSILSYLDGKEFMLQDTGVEKIYKNL